MSRRALFVSAGVAAVLSAGLFVHVLWLRIIQTDSPEALAWSGVFAFVAAVCVVAGVFRRR